ncbi:hypothetical protein B0H21DRAFT_474460 [Amylocystis lapponica]|nr:hypothetical protein B0H21DRAFT_474460 [Amylocystis lapponica]
MSFSCLGLSDDDVNLHYTSQCAFPVEVLDAIVGSLLFEKHAFSSIASFSLASYRLRQIALRRFFTRLFARSSTHWRHCCQISGISSWVRILESSSKTLTVHPNPLYQFRNLQSVIINFSSDGLATHQSRCKMLLTSLPSSLTHLSLTSLPQLTSALLILISSKFLALLVLELTCAERLDEDCCWLCYEESSSCTMHSPMPDVYSTLDDLVVAFAAALLPLQKLAHLSLGIFLSDLDVFYDHILHRDAVQSKTPEEISPPFGPEACPLCVAEHAAHVRTRELFASAALASALRSLKTISWSTFFAQEQPGDDVLARSTTAWVRRHGGKVQVRRAPWSTPLDG